LRKNDVSDDMKPGDLIFAKSDITGFVPYAGDKEVLGIYIDKFKSSANGEYALSLLVEGHLREYDNTFWKFEIVNCCPKSYDDNRSRT
tara:strand:+ start:475 stop:738 length:264 start_codon:yes stop_codon:yes gene_type:complete